MNVVKFAAGGYRYIEAMFQYSGGSAAEPGFEIVRGRFVRPLPMTDGFRAIEAHLRAAGRPLTAFCACELRSPKPFTEQGFVDFNRSYVQTLERWGLYKDGRNPVARSNVCPAYDVPPEPSFYAFSYTVPARTSRGTFIVAGSGEAPEGKGSYREHMIAPGDHSAEGVARDYEMYSPLVRSGGVIAVHDIDATAGGVPAFWRSLRERETTVEFVDRAHAPHGLGIGVIVKG